MFSFSLITSCEKEQLPLQSNASSKIENLTVTESTIDQEGEIILGKKLQIPYSLQIVEKAQNSLKLKSPKFNKFFLKENYLYVRFTPKSVSEYDRINSDSTINTFNRPLDYEIIKNGSKFTDPNIIDLGFGSIYCVIPKNNQFFDIKYDILEKLYIPFGSGGKDKESKRLEKMKDNNLEALDNEILEFTGYKNKNSKAKTADWNPSGFIRVANALGSTNFVPVQGCKVRTTKALVVTHSAITNTEGLYYITNSYWNISNVNYDIKWERDDFDIREGAWGQAYTNGPKLGTGWNLNIASDTDFNSYMYGWVNNAANYYYYYSNLIGIQAPPSYTSRPPIYGVIGLLLPQRMKLKATTVWSAGDASHYLDFNSAWFAAQISMIFTNITEPQQIFATTCHELGHASHWSFGYTTADYVLNANNNRRYAESWAQCIGWFITAKYFSPNRFVNYNNYIFPHNLPNDIFNNESEQDLTLNEQSAFGEYYTSAFIDLVDNFSQPNCPETANGYLMSELERAVCKSPTNWNSIRDRLTTEFPNQPTRAQKDIIFNTYRPQ
jgi:hypothetical protein